jgi:amidase
VVKSRQTIEDSLNAFCQDSNAYIEGAEDGPLSGLSFAAKDIFDVTGYVTGNGNPDWKTTHKVAEKTAWAIQTLVEAGATMVGKTITEELTWGLSGENTHYGVPVNPRAPGRIPGGSSSGSASAVAGGLVDFALGSDTLGSVRVPASLCGLYGIRPTHGRISFEGVLPQAPSYDTVGWFTRDVELFTQVGTVLLQNKITGNRPDHIIIAEDAFELTDNGVAQFLSITSLGGAVSTERVGAGRLTDWPRQQFILQSREAWESVQEWIEQVNPRMRFSVASSYSEASKRTDEELAAARADRKAIIAQMEEILTDGTVILLPTTPTSAPLIGEVGSDFWIRLFPLVTIASTIGAPQVNLPLAEIDGLPVGLSLIGPKGSDEMLIAFVLEVADQLGS